MKHLLLLIAASILMSACIKETVLVQEPPANKNVFHQRKVGASGRELLRADRFTSLTVEIQYMTGFKPEEETIHHMTSFLQTHLHKPEGIDVVLQEIPGVPNNTLSKDEVVSIEKKYRSVYVSDKRISIYFLITNGTHPGNKLLGMAYGNTSAVLYGKNIHNNVRPPGAILSRAELETSVLLHEIGHLLGLVNKGSVKQLDHEDRVNHNHCANERCLMFWLTETRNLSKINLKGHIPSLDEHCLEDLRYNGGKDTRGNGNTTRPFLSQF